MNARYSELHPSRSGILAISLLEVVIIISVLGILAGIGLATLNDGAIKGSQEAKLRSDLSVLNSAVDTYRAFGGDLTDINDPSIVVAKLKTELSEEQRQLMPGLGGAFLDPALKLVFQSDEEAATSSQRLYWDAPTGQFLLAHTGPPGIKALKLDPYAIKADHKPVTEERRRLLSYASESTWIWDYQEGAVPAPLGPSVIPVEQVADDTVVAGIAIPPAPVAKGTLSAPVFSIEGGSFSSSSFPLEIHLSDTNPPGAASVVYNINFGAWIDYNPGVPISVPPDSTIQAQAIPVRPSEWNPSIINKQYYTSFSSLLLPPIIDFSAEYFSKDKSNPVDSITVTLTNSNSPGSSEIIYQIVPIPGGKGKTTVFQTYSGSFNVKSSSYPSGFGIRAYASSLVDGYEDSRIATRFASEVQGLFGGHLDLDTSTFIAEIGDGSTDAHTHDITGKYGLNSINFFSIPDSKQIEISQAIKNPSQRFKLLVVNGSLSPGLSISMTYETDGITHRIDVPGYRYDDTELGDLTTFSLGGVSGSSKLTGLWLSASKDIIYQAGAIPTNTGEVKGNVLGRFNEWRNGSLTVQAVAVDSSGKDMFTTNESLSNGNHGAADSGLLWEAALFWHWDGDSYSESGNTFEPGELQSILAELDDPEAAEAYLEALRSSAERRIQITADNIVKARNDAEKAADEALKIQEEAEKKREIATIKAKEAEIAKQPVIEKEFLWKNAKAEADAARASADAAALYASQLEADPTADPATVDEAKQAAQDAEKAAQDAEKVALNLKKDFDSALKDALAVQEKADAAEKEAKDAENAAEKARKREKDLYEEVEELEELYARLVTDYEQQFGPYSG